MVSATERAELEIARLDGLLAGLGGAFIGDGILEGDPAARAKINERLHAVQAQVAFHNEMHPDAINAQTLERGQRWRAYLLDRAAALERGEELEERLPS